MHHIPWDVFVTVLVAAIGSTGLMNIINHKMQHRSAETKAIVALLHDHIFKRCEMYIERNGITVKELSGTMEIYGVYHALGGNGTATAYIRRIEKLPILAERAENDEKEQRIYAGSID